MVHQLQVTIQRKRNKELHGVIMPKNEMLGKVSAPTGRIDVSSPMTIKKPDIRKELFKTIRDFKVNMLTMSNTINNDLERNNIQACFNSNIVKVENLLHSMEEEIK
jgi:hypothetical protein